MAICTRLDGRSSTNNQVEVKDKQGQVVCTIRVNARKSADLEVELSKGLHLEKLNGYRSKENDDA